MQRPATPAHNGHNASPRLPHSPVTYTRRGAILLVMLGNLPANILSVDMRRGLLDALAAASADKSVKALLIVGAGKNFSVGMDFRESGEPPQTPALAEVCKRIEACRKPVIAALHGMAMDGGLEIALAAHYRVAAVNTRLALGVVQAGLMPNAGGTQRAPRLIGAQAALMLMLNSRSISAQQALQQRLVDRLAQSEDIVAEGLAYAQALLDARAPVRRTRRSPSTKYSTPPERKQTTRPRTIYRPCPSRISHNPAPRFRVYPFSHYPCCAYF